jgi:hypothetical protein
MLILSKSALAGLSIAAALSSAPDAGSDPQEVAGVRLGMPVADAVAAMGGSVRTIEMDVAGVSPGNQMFWDERGVTFLACKGRVTSVSVNTAGGFHELIAILKKDMAERGPVSVVVDNAAAGPDTLSSLSAKWPTSDIATYAVTYTVMDSGSPAISRTVNVNETCHT